MLPEAAHPGTSALLLEVAHLTTAYAGTAKQEAEAAGIVLLPKPYRLDELATVTADALGR